MREERIYYGDIFDTTNKKSEKFFEVNSCGVHIDATHRTVREKGRVDYLLIYVESGELSVRLGDCEETIGEGGFLIYPPFEKQNYMQISGVCYWIHFSGSSVEEVLSEAGLCGKVFFVGDENHPRISKIFERMTFHYAVSSPLRELTLVSELLSLICEIGKVYGTQKSMQIDERMRPVIVHMNKNYRATSDIDFYASMTGLSRGRFMHVFKESIGISPYSYLLSLRLERASQMLVSTSLTVSEIAFDAGFSDPLYFSRAFKKKYMISPAEFRKKSVFADR